MLGVRDFVKGEADVRVVEGGADEVSALGRHVGVGFAEDLCLGFCWLVVLCWFFCWISVVGWWVKGGKGERGGRWFVRNR